MAGLLLGACLPPQATYQLGLGTSRISGTLSLAEQPQGVNNGLVVALQYHHQFVTHADGNAVLAPTARVVQPGREGAFAIAVPGDVVRMELLFIAPEHLTEVFRFQRQLGVGDIRYRANLQAITDWRSHYYTFLSPQLQALLLEPRYRLAPEEQLALGAWMQAQDARLAAERAKR